MYSFSKAHALLQNISYRKPVKKYHENTLAFLTNKYDIVLNTRVPEIPPETNNN